MSGAIVNAPRTVAEREALLEFVADVHMDGQQAGNYACNYDSGKARAYAEKKVPPLPTRTRTVPRVVRLVSGEVVTYTPDVELPWEVFGPGGWRGRARHCAWLFHDEPFRCDDDDTIAALLDLKARPTETVEEPVVADGRCVGYARLMADGSLDCAQMPFPGAHDLAGCRDTVFGWKRVDGGAVHELLLGREVQP